MNRRIDGASTRADELASGLVRVRRRIDAACASAGRAASDVTLIVVTKTYPASDVRVLVGLGVHDVGENRDQEAAPKRDEVEAATGLGADLDVDSAWSARAEHLRWHCIGQVQTNKARSVARWADVIHSLDRPRLVTAMGRAATDQGRTLDALIQIGLDDESGRGGCAPEESVALAELVAATEGLSLRGVMAVAPLGADPRVFFERLGTIARRVSGDHPEATWISAGMSGDLDQAVAAGATHVRVGSAVLGARPAVG